MNQTHMQNHIIVTALDARYVEKLLHKKQVLKVMYKQVIKKSSEPFYDFQDKCLK